MKRGDVVTIALPGDFGKPRPALVIQSNLFASHPSTTVLPITSECRDTPLFRIAVPAQARTGLFQESQVMVDKAQTVASHRVGAVIGRLTRQEIQQVDRALAVFMGLI